MLSTFYGCSKGLSMTVFEILQMPGAYIAFITLFLACYYLLQRQKNFPPGPIGLPLVGYAPFLGKTPPTTFSRLAKKYGPIFSVQVGTDTWVVLNDYDAVNDALVRQGQVFSGRPFMPVFGEEMLRFGLPLIDHGDSWKSQRKFGMKVFKESGLKRRNTEEVITEEIGYLAEALSSFEGAPVNCQTALTNAVSNITCKLVFGQRFSYDDERFKGAISRLSHSVTDKRDAKYLGIMIALPFTRFFPGFMSCRARIDRSRKLTRAMLREIVEEHKKSFDPNHTRDFIDEFLVEMKNANDASFQEKQLLWYIHALFGAGTETTSNTLRWAVLALVHYPECQKKIASEIEDVIGSSAVPNMKHKGRMPYMSAFLQEIMRNKTLAPFAMLHKTSTDATLRGFAIPKGTTVVANLWSVNNDPNVFKNPEEFSPQRHINSNGQFEPAGTIIPFSVGPRHCLGDQLARMELFLFLVGILQRFKIAPDPSTPLPSFNDGVFGIVYGAHQFRVIFKQR